MPLSKLQFRPGFVKDGTEYANEGGWYDGNKVRFRLGFPEKIGGWIRLTNASFLGFARRLIQWDTLSGKSSIGVGATDKYYVLQDASLYDITPVKSEAAAGDVTFAAVSGSSTVTVTHVGHNADKGSFVSFSGAVSLGGNITADVLNQEYKILDVIGADTYTIEARLAFTSIIEITTGGSLTPSPVTASASDTGDGGVSVAATYYVKPQKNKDLSKPFDLISATYEGDSLDLSSPVISDGADFGKKVVFDLDGEKLFVLGDGKIYQYDLSTPFDLSTASYSGISFDHSTEISNAASFQFNQDGTKMYVSSAVSGITDLFQYYLSTPFDLSTAFYSGLSFTPQNVASDFLFSVDGKLMFTISIFSDDVFQYTLSSAFEISTASFDGLVKGLSDQTNAPRNMYMTPDGSYLYVLDGGASFSPDKPTIFEYRLINPYSVSSAEYTGVSFVLDDAFGNRAVSFTFSKDGFKLLVSAYGIDSEGFFEDQKIFQFDSVDGIASWSHDVFGEDLLISERGGPLYYWNASDGVDTRAALVSSLAGASDVPDQVNQVMVSDRDRHVIAFGCTPQGGTDLDPMLIRFSNQEDPANWTATATNTAGDLVLGSGSEIVTAVETRQQTLVLTDKAVYSMQFLGPPFTFGATRLSANTSIISPTAAAAIDDTVIWMGREEFFIYDGTVKPLPCPVQDYVFRTLDEDRFFKVVAGSNTSFGEVWWFYPCSVSGECDRYVVYNYEQNIWYTGTLRRDSWVDRAVGGKPVGAGPDGYLYYHETGQDDGSTNPPTGMHAWIESSPIDVEDGDRWTVVNQLVPDVDFRDSKSQTASVEMTLKAFDRPGDAVLLEDSGAVVRSAGGTVDTYTDKLDVRLNGRAFNLRIESTDTGVAWRSGHPRVDILPNKGRR